VSHLAYLIPGWILLVGVYGIVTSRNLVHAVVCLSVAQSATYVLLLTIGYRRHATAPVFSDVKPTGNVVDPIVQALTLTDIVVEATVTALLLALTVQAKKRFGTVDPAELDPLKG
jgi:multicomponent Na+:H+ antiporter subunit C